MNLAVCGKTAFSGCYLAVFSVEIVLAWYFVAPHSPPTLLPYRSASGIGEIQLSIQCGHNELP